MNMGIKFTHLQFITLFPISVKIKYHVQYQENQRNCNLQEASILVTYCLGSLFSESEDGGSTVLRNVGELLPDYTV
jgi:hypothetical protein